MFRDTNDIIGTLLKFPDFKDSLTGIQPSYLNFSSLVPFRNGDGNVDIEEKTTLFQPDHIHLTPIKKWTPSKIPLGPLEDFQQIWVNHVDEYGQIVRNSA